ncbi:MAG TPA: hypothetical protein VGM89_06825 [Puia sp.]
MSPKLAMAFLLAASATLVKGQSQPADSIRDSYHIFFPATGKDILAAHIGSHFYKVVNVYEKPSEVYVDDKRIADDELTQYNAIIERIRTSVKDDDEEREMRQMVRDRRQSERDARQAEHDREQQTRDKEQQKRDRVQQKMDQFQQKLDLEQQKHERDQEKREREQEKREREPQKRDQGPQDYDSSEQEQREQSAEDRQMLKKGIQLLVDEHIINNSQNLKTLILTDSDVSVNGVRQPQNVYQQIRSRLGDWATHGLSYGVAGPADNYLLSIND